MHIPLVKIKHSKPSKLILRQQTKFISLKNFDIKFIGDEIYIDMGIIDINFYCLELVNPIAKVSYYYQFFPLWIDYHFLQKYMIDEDYKELYISDLAERQKVAIKFESVNININEYEISSAAILQANYNELERNAARQNVVNYLKNIKSNNLSLIVNNFTIVREMWRDKFCQYYEENNKVYYYYKTITESI